MHPTTTPKTILLADDDASILTVLTRAMTAKGYTVKATDTLSDVDAWVAQGLGDAIVTDVLMPRGNGLDGLARWHAKRPELPVIVMSAHNTLLNAARSQELGAVTFLPKPFDLDALMEALARATGQQATAAATTTQAVADDGIVRVSEGLTLVGKSPAMQQLFRELAGLIGNDLTVLITGESGTGKDRIARAVHALSKRKDKPFIALNMAAIPRELIESTLFGHEKGAFTGAVQRQLGAFQRAHGGTLFLDEIGDMPMEAQTRLLRVLQEQEMTPVGATEQVATDVRVIAATHRDLPALVRAGTFREDLYFRLHVLPLAVPALRERREDMELLVTHFMQAATARGLRARTLDAASFELLSEQRWPGNVRELEHLIYRLCALPGGATVQASELERMLAPAGGTSSNVVPLKTPAPAAPAMQGMEALIEASLAQYFATLNGTLPAAGLYERVLEQLERPLLLHTLRATNGNQIKAAEILGINRNTLRKKMRLLGIDQRSMWKSAA
ncbi:MAG: nitrogen regulation protein NR(I) [Azospirillum brasilense]|nr:MAG: nitrogen regulation protein NR(I) [Azospirillum brasilense]